MAWATGWAALVERCCALGRQVVGPIQLTFLQQQELDEVELLLERHGHAVAEEPRVR